MSFRNFKLLILFLFSLSLVIEGSAFSLNKIIDIFHKEKQAKPSKVISADHAMHVKVGIYMLHIGKYDLETASTPMDFYLIFECKPVCNHINFEIVNATTSNIHLVAKPPGSLIYRVQANLTKPDNLRNFPFDSHTLDIIIEAKELTKDKLVFEADPNKTALDKDLSVIGYEMLPQWYVKVTDHYYSVFNRTYSSYKFSMLVKRPWLAGILKGILPALIVVGCSFLALFMKIQHISQRIGIGTSTLITIAVFHLTLTSSLPPLGYVTYADMFMLINYLCLFAILIEIVVTTYFIETKHHDLAEIINIRCAWLIPLIWFILQIAIWLIFDPL